jgi:AcrR family transcriptional regulator
MDLRKNARDDILRTADKLFYRDGLHAVGINQLISESGVAKDTFYRHFRSKENLIEAYLTSRHEASMKNFFGLIAEINDPRQQLLAVFRDLCQRVQRSGFRGCAFVMMMGEYSHVPALAGIARNHKERQRHEIEKICAEFCSDADRMARKLCLLYEGFLSQSAVAPGPEDRYILLETVDDIVHAKPHGQMPSNPNWDIRSPGAVFSLSARD